MISAQPLDLPWLTCLVLAYVFYFMRKSILNWHGISTGILDLDLKDGSLLRELAEDQAAPKRRKVYLAVNTGFALFFVLAILLLITSRAPLGRFTGAASTIWGQLWGQLHSG